MELFVLNGDKPGFNKVHTCLYLKVTNDKLVVDDQAIVDKIVDRAIKVVKFNLIAGGVINTPIITNKLKVDATSLKFDSEFKRQVLPIHIEAANQKLKEYHYTEFPTYRIKLIETIGGIQMDKYGTLVFTD